jgi:large subunit ribosomal protein L22
MTTTDFGARTQARAVARYVRMTPMKVRRVVDLVRGMPAVPSVDVLRFAPQAAAEPVRKVLESAIANAEQTMQANRNDLKIVEAFVDEGPTMKRWRPRAQGRPGPYFKRTSHITIVVEVPADLKDQPESKKNRRTR